jgi:hypothetical protein
VIIAGRIFYFSNNMDEETLLFFENDLEIPAKEL